MLSYASQTPRAYAQKVQRYAPGDPRRRVAAARAVLAMRAAEAAQRQDFAGARHALSGLEQLATFGDVDTAAISARISRDLTNAAGRLTPDARAIATGQRVSGIISTVAGIVGPVTQIIAQATNDPGIIRAVSWMNLIIAGQVSPSFGEDDLRLMAGACGAWNTQVKPAVLGIKGLLLLALAAAGGDAATVGPQVVNSLFGWITTALDTICTNLATVFPPASLAPSCAGAGVRPGSGDVPAGAAGCCPGLVFDPGSGRCQNESTVTPVGAAMARWVTAWTARRNVEVFLSGVPGVSATAIANAQANDASTAAELCAAETALLVYRNPIPARGTVPTADAAARSMTNTLTLAATFYSPPSTRPRCYILRPPASGCSCGGVSSGGGSGGIVAFALPAAALVWYMMKG